LLVAALVEHFDRHGAVLDLVRGPGVQANIDAAGGEGRDVGDENEDVTDELRVGAPRERVENTGDGYDEVDSGWVFGLEDTFDSFKDENVLAHAHRRRN